MSQTHTSISRAMTTFVAVRIRAGRSPVHHQGHGLWPKGLRSLPAWLLSVVLTACATYHPKALPATPDLATTPALSVPANRFDIPGLEPHRFSAVNGLGETDVVLLALANNPMIKSARMQAGVARAQLLAAGLLPDPELSVGMGYPTSGPPPLFNAYDLGLSEDIQALVTHNAVTSQARAHQQQVNLQILWKEWQLAQRARELFIKSRAESQLSEILTTARDLNAAHYGRDEAALRQGNVTLATVSADLTALVDAETRLRKLERQRNRTRHALHLLLGLAPEVPLHLTGQSDIRPISASTFKSAVAELPHRRADLLALRAGYESQEQGVRKAILAQFPSMHLGLTAARDTQDVHTIGFGITLTLPVFNRNQGQIAVARATREVLRETYQARLDGAVSDAHRVWSTIQILSGQLHALEQRLPALQRTEAAVERSFREGNVDAGTYISLRTSLLAKRAEAVQLHASMAKARATLVTLLGMPLPPAASPEVNEENG